MLTLTIIILPGIAYSQKSRGFFKLSPSVQLWIITHPFSACSASKITDKAINMTMIVKDDPRLDGLENGGQVDAFRHAYWMALMSQQYNCRRAYRLGKAHEKGNVRDFRKGRLEEGELPDSVSVEMDMYNNCVGVIIGFENAEASENELAEIVIDKILAGEMRIIKRNPDGRFMDCDNQIIQTGEWQGKWQNSRCLVRSNNTPPEK